MHASSRSTAIVGCGLPIVVLVITLPFTLAQAVTDKAEPAPHAGARTPWPTAQVGDGVSMNTTDGLRWMQLTPMSPGPRDGSAFVFDADCAAAVLFGGGHNSDYLNDTWAWDGFGWTLLGQTGPVSPRHWSGAAFDGRRQRVVLFGGRPQPLADTWLHDCENWSAQGGAGPNGRSQAAMTYDALRQLVLLQGGQGTSDLFHDTWTCDNGAWTKVADAGPSGRRLHTMAFHGSTGTVVLFGGLTDPSTVWGDTWIWDGSWTQLVVPGPSARLLHTMTYDVARDVIVLWGGSPGGWTCFTDTWEWNGAQWTQCAGTGTPTVRQGQSMCYDERHGVCVLYGGLYYDGSQFIYRTDTWIYGSDCNDNGLPDYIDILTQPVSQTLCAGEALTVSVQTQSWETVTYQWRKNGEDIPDATAASYSIASAGAADTGDYDCVVTNGCAPVYSAVATVVVNGTPTINQHPLSQIVCHGDPVTLSVTASGSSDLGYQWRRDGNTLDGATSSAYTVASATAGDIGLYDCLVTNMCGSATSAAAMLSVRALTIDGQPQDSLVCEDAFAQFCVSPSGDGPFAYQWRRDGTPLQNANQPCFHILHAQLADTGSYDCVVTNAACTAVSAPAALTVGTVPSIDQQPSSATHCLGEPAEFCVLTSGLPELTYQWRHAGVGIPNAVGACFSIAVTVHSSAVFGPGSGGRWPVWR